MRQMLVTLFNDKDEKSVRSLERSISEIEGINKLRYPPQVANEEVGDELVKQFENMKLVPTLFFVDPFGYKGLSLQLINSVLKNWGCDCIIFFNYNRINMGLGNESVERHLNALFGKTRADKLREKIDGVSSHERELYIVEEICEALKDLGGDFTLPFRFRNSSGSRTSHHLIFVSKHVRGYEIMKEVMAKESSSQDQEVASFEYNQASKNQPTLFSLSQPLDRLGEDLLQTFAGRRMTRDKIYNSHHVGTPYIKKNYNSALKSLENKGKIEIDHVGQRRRQVGQYGNSTFVRFPKIS